MPLRNFDILLHGERVTVTRIFNRSEAYCENDGTRGENGPTHAENMEDFGVINEDLIIMAIRSNRPVYQCTYCLGIDPDRVQLATEAFLNCGHRSNWIYFTRRSTEMCHECFQGHCRQCRRNEENCVCHPCVICEEDHPSNLDICRSCGEDYTNCRGCQAIILRSEPCTDCDYCNACNMAEICTCDEDFFHFPPILCDNEKFDPYNLYLGIEYEIESKTSIKALTYAVSQMRIPFLEKGDASIRNGREFCFFPFSKHWYEKNNHKFDHAFPILEKVANAGRRPGIHIHLNKKAFTTMHLYRFLKFMYEQKDMTLQVAGRAPNRYCEMGPVEDITKRMIKIKQLGRSDERYQTINLRNNNASTYEVRMFASTTDTTRFKSNIEYMFALYEFTKRMSIDQLTTKYWEAFLEMSNYENLKKILDREPKIKTLYEEEEPPEECLNCGYCVTCCGEWYPEVGMCSQCHDEEDMPPF